MNAVEKRTDNRWDGFYLVAGLAVVMWILEIIDSIVGGSLDSAGIEPRDPDGLPGIVAAPFLHAGFGHLISNTVPFLVLGFVIAFNGLKRVAAVTLIVMAVGGLGVWLFAPAHSIHIGASGLVFGYAAYILSRGIFDRDMLELAVAAIVAVIYGGALLGGLIPQDGISWQGHLFGGVGGVLAAWLLSAPRRTSAGRTARQGAAETP